MENFLETNSNENSFLFLTLSNKYFKKCPAMEHCKNSLDCFNYYASIVKWLSRYNPISSIEKYHDTESYHLHIILTNHSDISDDNYYNRETLIILLSEFAENHLEKYTSASWKIFKDKYDNDCISYGPSFKLQIVNTIENKNAIVDYVNKYKEDQGKIRRYLLELLVTKFLAEEKPKKKKWPKNKMEFYNWLKNDNDFERQFREYRNLWDRDSFKFCYYDYINLEE